MWKWLDNLYTKDIHDASDGTVVPPHISGIKRPNTSGMSIRKENDSIVLAERLLFVYKIEHYASNFKGFWDWESSYASRLERKIQDYPLTAESLMRKRKMCMWRRLWRKRVEKYCPTSNVSA